MNLNAFDMDMELPMLPWDIICDIISRFPIEDIIRFICLSKSCYSLKNDATFIKMQLNKAKRRILLERRFSNPLEELLTGLYLMDGLEDDEGNKMKGRMIPILPRGSEGGGEVYLGAAGSCNGLVCVHSSNSREVPLFVYNPVTRESVTLPLSNPKGDFCVVTTGFGYDSESGKYKVVKVFKIDRVPSGDNGLDFYIEGEIITVGEKKWRRVDVPYVVMFGMRSSPVFSGGALNYMIDKAVHPDGEKRILALDLDSEKWRTIEFAMTVRHPDGLHIVNFDDSLAIIERGGWDKLRVCKIMGSKDGYKIRKHSYDLNVARTPQIWSLSFRGFWNNGNFLVQCMPMNSAEVTNKKDQLALYYPKKKEFRTVELFGVPDLFRAMFFVPSFVSPTT